MDLRQLNALAAVSEHRSFSAAAKALHTVQSNVSTHVARLEAELGATLIDRATVELTAEGRLVVERFRRINQEFSALESDLASMRDFVQGTVRVGVIGTTARWLVPALLNEVGEHFPGIRLVILDATTSSLVLQLVGGQLEMAIINIPVEEPDLRLTPLFDEDRVLVVPVGHPLEHRDVVTLADLAEHELLLPAEGTGFRLELDADAAAAGVTLRAGAEVDGMRLLASLAFSGFGASILPASAAPNWLDGQWRTIAVEGIGRRSVGLARRQRGMPSAAERAVASAVTSIVNERGVAEPGVHPRADNGV